MNTAAPVETDRNGMLEQLLSDARVYVQMFEPRNADEQEEQERLLRHIEKALPVPASPPLEYCAEDGCCRSKGHEGEHDYIPF